MKKPLYTLLLLVLLSAGCITALAVQNSTAETNINEIQQQKKEADKEIKETKKELGINEKKVTESLNSLKKLDEDIRVSQGEITSAQNQLTHLKDTITRLESSIETHESDLGGLRDEYLKAVKKMRSARKRNSDLVFVFASKNMTEAGRRMRYLREFSDWRDRRSDEILNKVSILQHQRKGLVQAREDVSVAITREKTAQDKLSRQRQEQQVNVTNLRANSEVLKSKLLKRQQEARALSGRISQLIAQEQAREAEARRKAAEEQAARERAAAQKAEEERLAREKAAAERAAKEKAAEEKRLAENAATKSTPKQETKPSTKPEAKPAPAPDKSEYAQARNRRSRRVEAAPEQSSEPKTQAATRPVETPRTPAPSADSGFGSMKGSLPRPVSGSFKVVSAFGVHPISPELPDIMDENLGIDAHVANGAKVTAVYDGEVIKIYDRSTVPGFRNIVVVKHGDYLTVYANLETLAVKSGQKVKQGQVLGSVGSDFDNPSYGMIHFEVWKNQTHLDPAGWIKI